MSLGGLTDPDAIDALARKVEGRADEVRSSVRSFESAVAGVVWQSTAAETWQGRCEDVASALRGNAEELDDVADRLRQHADLVRDRIAWVHEQVDGLREKARDAAEAAEEVFDWGVDKADDALKEVLSWF